MDTKVSRWGNSLGVRLPKSVTDDANLRAGDSVSISVGKRRSIVLVPRKRRPTLDELLEGMTDENRQEEILWGPPRGREEW